MSTTSSLRFILVLLLVLAVCSANLATGRASLRPSAGKRSVIVGRTPAHYYQLTAKRFDDELTCNMNTMSVLSERYERLQIQLEEVVELIEACQTLRNAL